MLVCATHTHSAPKGGEGMPGREEYEKLKYQKLEEAIVLAIQSIEPAMVGFSSEDEPSEVRNRRWFLQPGTMPPNPQAFLNCFHLLTPFFFGNTSKPIAFSSFRILTHLGGK